MERFLGRPAHTLRGGGGQQIKRRQRPGAITKIKCRLLRWAARGFGWFAWAHWWGFAPCIGRLRADRHGLGRRIGGAQHGAQGDFRFLAAEQAASAGFEARDKAGEKAGLLRFRFLSRAQPFRAGARCIQSDLAGAKRRAASAAPFAEGQAAADEASADGTEHQPGFGQQRAIGAETGRKPGNHAIGQKRPHCAARACQAWRLRRQGGQAQRRSAQGQGKGKADKPEGDEAKAALGYQPKGPGEQRQHGQGRRITRALQQDICHHRPCWPGQIADRAGGCGIQGWVGGVVAK